VQLLQPGEERPAGAARQDVHLPLEQVVPDRVVVGRVIALLGLEPVLADMRGAGERRGEHIRATSGRR
jgi:hypothetical protein